MEALSKVRAFKATDAFVLEAYRDVAGLRGRPGEELARELRTVVVRCGAALVAASAAGGGGSSEQGWVASARSFLAESRYYLYRARRLGLIDQRRYRGLVVRHDAALRELDALSEPGSPG